eukprot:m.23479 g.23479  ORF g.23479 m.23479 type:complete len:142 (+) comp10988_c0_seq1:553-978(+)
MWVGEHTLSMSVGGKSTLHARTRALEIRQTMRSFVYPSTVHCPDFGAVVYVVHTLSHRAETGYKRRVHCVFTNSGDHEKVPQDTYESCSPASSDRIKFFTFEAMCAIVGLVFVFGANKRKALLYDRIERKLRQQIDNVDMV